VGFLGEREILMGGSEKVGTEHGQSENSGQGDSRCSFLPSYNSNI
jgi:hypothetical protein